HRTKPGLLVESVDLDDDAVGLVRQLVALLAPSLGELDDGLDVEPGLAVGLHREAEDFEPLEGAGLARHPDGCRIDDTAGGRAAGCLDPGFDELVEPGGELPRRRDLRILLPKRARAAVPR